MSVRPKLFVAAGQADKFNCVLLSRFFSVTENESIDALKASVNEAEAVLLYGEEHLDDALALARESTAAVLLITESFDTGLLNRCTPGGVLYTQASELSKLISPLYAMTVRLGSVRKSTVDLRRKLDDSKLVDRAKLLLMTSLGMTETQAHKYIEKTAMNGCVPKREVAVAIIKTYES